MNLQQTAGVEECLQAPQDAMDTILLSMDR